MAEMEASSNSVKSFFAKFGLVEACLFLLNFLKTI
jgi:hypothetical protein